MFPYKKNRSRHTHTPNSFMLIAFKNDHDESQQNMCKKVKRALNYTPLNTIYGCKKNYHHHHRRRFDVLSIHPQFCIKLNTRASVRARESEHIARWKRNERIVKKIIDYTTHTHSLHSPSDIIKLKSIQASFFRVISRAKPTI